MPTPILPSATPIATPIAIAAAKPEFLFIVPPGFRTI
jgi:hypothetical protein